LLDQTFHIFASHDAVEVGPPTDTNEAAKIQWVSADDVRALLLDGKVTDGLTFAALGFAFTAGLF
jgi:8-oxo-dGTP pyrophosphatase MutT (NUDIX family)